jgi:precorrin-6B methylase 2
MQLPRSRLATYGWNDSTAALLEALRENAGLTAVAVGDERPAPLVRARAATGLPGFQHVREMVRSASFEAILVGGGEHAADVAEAAAARGVDILLIGAVASAETLSRAAAAAHRHRVRLTVLRPWLQGAAPAAALERLRATPPDLVMIEAAEPRAPMRLLRDLVAFAVRALDVRAVDVSATRAGEAFEGAPLTAHVRFAGGRVVVLSARMALTPALRVLSSSADRTLELRARDGSLTIEESSANGESTQLVSALQPLRALDTLVLEAQRVRVPAETALDAQLATGEAAILDAAEQALEGSFAEQVEVAPRPFQVLRGGGRAPSPRDPASAPSLSLVSR